MPKRHIDHPDAPKLYAELQITLHERVAAHMRRLGVPADPTAAPEIAYDACVRLLRRPEELRPLNPQNYLGVIVRRLVIARFCRASKLAGLMYRNTALEPLSDLNDEQLSRYADDPTADLMLAIDLNAGLSALEKEMPEEHYVIWSRLNGKSPSDLQSELGVSRDEVNNRLRRAMTYLIKHFSDRENES